MSNVWALIEESFVDAHKAEDLLRDAQGRREIRLDPDAALALFAAATRP
jgi:hypothetical protein